MQNSIYIVLLLHLSCRYASSFHESGYIVTSPSVFRTSVDHVINVRIFNHAEPVRVKVQLWNQREDLIASASSEVDGFGSTTIKVPSGREGKATLRVCGNCHLNTGFRFSNQTSVTIVDKGSSAFIQTDKPVYKPAQTVLVNIYTIDRDLRPVNENVTVYVTAPNDVKMMQWRNLRPVCCGVINISLPLSDQPVLGTWTIFAEINQESYNTTFEIKKYVLPKFEVSIAPPSFFRNDSEEISVGARYVFGKPVSGQMEVNVSVRGVGYSRNHYLDVGAPIIRRMQISGQARFSICLRQLLPEDLNPYFRGSLNIYAKVISEDGTEIVAFDDSTPVSRTKVDIEFTADTRSHFKPGIAFTGKIKAFYLDQSAADHVTLLLKVRENGNRFLTRELTSDSRGVVRFTVPPLTESSRIVSIQARVIAIQGEPVGANYRSIELNLHNWLSASKCHLLVEGPETKPEAGDATRLLVKSSCPCNFTLFYEILSRGNIVKSGSKIVRPNNSEVASSRKKRSLASFGDQPIELPSSQDQVLNTQICSTDLDIQVTADMAPLSRVLIYYVREDGEGIADSIRLPVIPKLQNEIDVVMSPSETSPGTELNVHITSSPRSCVCLAIVDRSVHLLKPNYMLHQDDIFEELAGYDLDNLPFEQEVSWWKLSRAKRNAHLWWSTANSRDAKYAFLESGLVVMTNVVSLDHKMSSQLSSHQLRQSMEQSRRSDDESTDRSQLNRERVSRRLRSFFPETWMWNCFNMSSGRRNFTLTVPDAITTWQANAVSLNPNLGIGISHPETLRSFKSFFVDFNLPYSVIRGEEVQIPLTVHNYLNTCVQASLAVLLPPGISFRRRGSNRMVKHLCIHPQSTATTRINLRFTYLGSLNISAMADAIVGSTSCCSSNEDQRRVIATDYIRRSVLVEAEGIKRGYTHSVYFCPNERINITTPPENTFQFVKLPKRNTGFDFLARAQESVHILLAEDEFASSASYEIVLGGSDNEQSWISKDSQHMVTAATSNILSKDEFRSFWISWSFGNIQVGTGSSERTGECFMQWRAPTSFNFSVINYVGFSTRGGSSGEFRLWKTEESEGSIEELFSLTLPLNVVEMSGRAKASAIGDVMGPTLKNLNNLLNLPFGCGEQNLANFAPNVYVLKYLKGTNQITEATRVEAIRHLQTGYQRQLTYKRSDNSYSPFGDRDRSGSMWLTSFVLKSFSQARDFIYIDPKELHEAKDWILSWQSKDGSFPAVGKIWNKRVQAEVDGDIALTAYVTIALLEAGVDREDEQIAIMKAQEFLEQRSPDVTDSYTASLVAYALTVLESDFAADAQTLLLRESITNGGCTHWSLREEEDTPDDEMFFIGLTKQTVLSAEIEIASYALMTFTHLHNHSTSLPIVKWLSKQRNGMGGFSSTQDTCVALQALSEYAIFSFIVGVNLSVELETTNNFVKKFEMNNNNHEVLQTADIATFPTTMFVRATGDGCALLQIDVTYNIPNPKETDAFYLKVRHHRRVNDVVNVEEQGNNNALSNVITSSRDLKYELEACTRWVHAGSSNMAVLEFSLLTGFRADLESLERTLERNTINLKRYEVSGRKILFYFDEISSICNSCVRFLVMREFEAGKVMAQPVKIYDYYEPSYETEVTYKPSREMMESLCRNSSSSCDDMIETDDDCENSAEGCWGGYEECHCPNNCGFMGPRVCGSNGIFYINHCRMQLASCELSMEIYSTNYTICERPTEVDIPSYDPVEEEPINNDYDEWYPENSEEDVIIPSLQQFPFIPTNK